MTGRIDPAQWCSDACAPFVAREDTRPGGDPLTSSEPPSSSARVAARPSLGGSASASADNLRMLESLGAGVRPLPVGKRAQRRWPALAFAVLASGLLAGLVWWMPSTPDAASPATAVSAAAARTNSVLPTPSSSSAGAEIVRSAALAPAPARIETLDHAKPVDGAPRQPDPFAALAASAPSVAASSAAPAVVARPAPGSAAKPTTKTAKANKPRSETTRHVAANTPPKPAPRDSARVAASKDPDVDLLAALMTHLSSSGSAAPGAAAPRAPNKPVDEPTIAKLVQRCQAMGGDEGRQCQRRICDGYWGKAQACPARLAAKASSTS